jgi:hypothetical protein
MQRIMVLLGLCILHASAYAQSLKEFTYLKDKFEGEGYVMASGVLVNLSNKDAFINPQAHNQTVPFIDIYFLKPRFSLGGLNRRVDYKLITDIFWLFKTITEKDASKLNASVGSTLSTGLIGWQMFHWNVTAKQNRTISLGFSLNDYFIGSINQDTMGKITLKEPQGWQIGIGPAVGINQRLSNEFILMASTAYVVNVLRPVSISYAQEDNAYPKPHVWHGNITLMSKWGLFTEMQISQLINKGNIPNATRRIDFKLGFAFVL